MSFSLQQQDIVLFNKANSSHIFRDSKVFARSGIHTGMLHGPESRDQSLPCSVSMQVSLTHFHLLKGSHGLQIDLQKGDCRADSSITFCQARGCEMHLPS